MTFDYKSYLKNNPLLEEVNEDRYYKNGYTPEQVASIESYLGNLNLTKLKINGSYYWVKEVGDEYPIVQFRDGTVYMDDDIMEDIMNQTTPEFGSPETSGDKGYNPPTVAFGNAALEWVVKQLGGSDEYLNKRLTGTVIFRSFEKGKEYSKYNLVPKTQS
jgi:hypothetical protein